ncbi:hypothetical protein TNCV_4863711 [Trichonephila clavipes]|nr:hypothetical protein TNCV_4863711 [Trichonephila clavipes]
MHCTDFSAFKSVVWTEKKKEKWDDKKRVENREGSLGYPGFVTPVFTKDSKHGCHLGISSWEGKVTRAPWDCDTRTRGDVFSKDIEILLLSQR